MKSLLPHRIKMSLNLYIYKKKKVFVKQLILSSKCEAFLKQISQYLLPLMQGYFPPWRVIYTIHLVMDHFYYSLYVFQGVTVSPCVTVWLLCLKEAIRRQTISHLPRCESLYIWLFRILITQDCTKICVCECFSVSCSFHCYPSCLVSLLWGFLSDSRVTAGLSH